MDRRLDTLPRKKFLSRFHADFGIIDTVQLVLRSHGVQVQQRFAGSASEFQDIASRLAHLIH